MFRTYTKEQAIEFLTECCEFLLKVMEKGDLPFEDADKDAIDHCISLLCVLMNDTDLELQSTKVVGALVNAQTIIQTIKINSKIGPFIISHNRTNFEEAILFVNDAINLLKQ